MSLKSQNFRELLPSAQFSSRNENFVSTSKSLPKNRNWTFPVVCYFTWKLEFASNILWIIFSGNSFFLHQAQDSFKLDLFDNLFNSRDFDTVLTLILSKYIVKKCWNLFYLITTFSIFSLSSKFGIKSFSSLV